MKRFLYLQKRRFEKFTFRQMARPGMLANLALNLRECRKGKVNLRSLPWNIIVELTANCNLRCPMCPVGMAGWDPSKEMQWDLFARIGRRLFPKALMVDLRSQGESTIARHWEEALDFIEPFRAQFKITTNGMKLTPKICDRMAGQQMAVTVSFDGATRDTFEANRAGSDFERICRNIRTLSAAQRKHKNPARNLALRMTLQRNNLDEIPGVIQLAHEMGVKVVHLQPVDTQGDEREIKHEPDRAKQQILKGYELGRELGLLEVEIPSFRHLLGEKDEETTANVSAALTDTFCNDPWKTINIAHDGSVYACCYGNMPYLGNLNEENFDLIWNAERYQDLRAAVNSAQPWPECRVCYPKNRFG